MSPATSAFTRVKRFTDDPISWPTAAVEGGIPIGPREMALMKWCDEVDVFCDRVRPATRIPSVRVLSTRHPPFRPYVWHGEGWEKRAIHVPPEPKKPRKRKVKMAKRIILIDDIDGTPAEETIRFGIDGSGYEIDLSSENADRFREEIAPLINVARRAPATARQQWEAIWAADLARRQARHGLGP